MERWSLEHRTFAVEQLFRNNDSVIQVQRLFRQHFNIDRHGSVPKRDTILRWVHAFRTTGSVMKKKPSGLPRSVRTPENIERVREAVTTSPQRSARRQAAALQISDRSVRRILHQELKFHPYKLMVVQQLQPRDYHQRLTFAERMLEILAEDPLVIMMSDEANFYLNGMVNKQNCRYWAVENPSENYERPLHSPKVTVWCGVSERSVVGPYFFEMAGNTVTINSERYVTMLNDFLRPELRRQRMNMRRMWFQQDGATAHTAGASMEVVHRMFPQHVISRFGDVAWPPRSPDLSICDFFLWGYLKGKVYISKPRTLEELKDSIRREIAAIDNDLLQTVMQDFRKRLQECVRQDGHHLSDVIFKT